MNTRTGPVRKIISRYSNIFFVNIIPRASIISSRFLIKRNIRYDKIPENNPANSPLIITGILIVESFAPTSFIVSKSIILE